MSLPKINSIIYDVVIPSTGKKVTFRTCTRREEKILLTAKVSDDPVDFFRAAKQVVNNCAVDPGFEVDDLATFDLEYVFIRIRAMSISNIAHQAWIDSEDQKTYEFDVDLMAVEVEFPKNISNKISCDENTGIIMSWPSVKIFEDKEFFKAGDEAFFELVLRCVVSIYDKTKVYKASDYTREEMEEFLDDLPANVWAKVVEFMGNTPKLKYDIDYKNSAGSDRKIKLRTLTDFFTL